MFQARRGSIHATVGSDRNIRLSTVHSGARGLVRVLDERATQFEVVIERADLDDAIIALQRVRDEGKPSSSSPLVRVARGIGLSDLGAVPEEMADTCLKVIAHERDIAGALRRDLTAARADSEQLRRMVFANDRVLFDGRPARTRSCSACHVGAVPDPYSLAPLDVSVKDAPATAVMAIAVGSVDIFETTREAREIADRARRPVAFDCQGFTVVVNPDEDPEAVARAWWWTRHGETPEQSAARR